MCVRVDYAKHGRKQHIQVKETDKARRAKNLSSLEFSGPLCPSPGTNKAAAFLVCRAALCVWVGGGGSRCCRSACGLFLPSAGGVIWDLNI